MPIGSKIKDLLKKITVQNPKTKQDVQLGSALASKDPNLKKIGQKKVQQIQKKVSDKKKSNDEPKEKPNPEYEKAKKSAIANAEKMAKENPMVTSPIQTRKGVAFPGDKAHYWQTGYDPTGEHSVNKDDFEKAPEDKKNADIKPIEKDKDTKRMGDSIQKKIGGSKDPDRLEVQGTQKASNGETIIQYKDKEDGSMVGVDAQGNIYEDGEKKNYGVDVSTQSDVFGDDQNAQLQYKDKDDYENDDETNARIATRNNPYKHHYETIQINGKKYRPINELQKMRPAVKKLLKQKGYSPIFQAIDNSKRQFKQMRYSRGEIQDTLIDMFGDEDPKILQKIKESVKESKKELTRKEVKHYIKNNKNKVMEQVLRKIIKEEVKSVITEGTRWLVGIEGGNGKILSTYGHYDGYPEWAGKHLKKYYNNPAKVKQLLKLGKAGISTIGSKIKGSKDHSFEKPDKDVTVFYGRDRGEKGNMTSNWGNRDKVKFDSGEEYAYIYNLKEKQWYYKSRYSNPQDWTELN